ncbi:hypothetical protein CC86DRAFT_353077 [Ophiobolus disseminans]|uniref:Uncharacterized protein n=1 Tax=Ophiobolus disseminans TaxID=1469910 RepID=A0A6A6ZV63_9PLEO|nr:hypothetical protein CC86DRAFT_353077 [Ophiobolus disseminans]
MALTDRTAPTVVPRAHVTTPHRSRLPAVLKVPILIVLNFGLRTALWSVVSNFLNPELGAVSKVPSEADFWSLYSPGARLLMNAFTNGMNWYFNYDFFDVAALTVLTNAPYAYLLATYYEISSPTVAAHTIIEVLAIAFPTYLLRPRSVVHKPNAPLRNRFLLNSVQVQFSNALLAMGVYVVVLWAGLKTSSLNPFLVTYFDLPTLATAYDETPLSILGKVFIAGIAAKDFLLNPSIAAQPLSDTATPVEQFDPATATLDQTIQVNVLPVEKRKRRLVQQTIVLNIFLFVSTVQRCMTLDGAQFRGAAGYAGVWVLANTITALWYVWVGDTSSDYEPL